MLCFVFKNSIDNRITSEFQQKGKRKDERKGGIKGDRKELMKNER